MPALKAMSIRVNTQFIQEQSNSDDNEFVFAYTVKINNHSQSGARLLTRHWIITDADGDVKEVKGKGVLGEQPYIAAGESYEYTSGAILKTPLGTMEGSYQMQSDDGVSFEMQIPLFSLTQPGILH